MLQTKLEEHFRENVFVYDFLSTVKKNELHRKYKVFGWSTKNAKAPPILEIEQN